MSLDEILTRVGHHQAAIAQAHDSITDLARKALRTPEVKAMPGAQVRLTLMSWGLSEAEATALIVERIRERREARRATSGGI